MTISLETLFFQNIFVFLFGSFFLWFYQSYNKVYPGFGFWTAGSLCASASFLCSLLRPFTPLWLSVLFVQSTSILSVLLRF
ncbi:MAG TPA: hypothetical protein PKO06_22660, partial [Candidatus Ozemobacteraceae bacterium]|nr:hypothetical protein [Candidatus Ozemobacteraceae bacterium]